MPQSRPTANPRYQEEEKKDIFFFFFFLLFSAYKNVKSFYTEKSKKNAFCLWHVRPFNLLFMAYAANQFQNSNPTLQGPTTPKRDRLNVP